MPVMASRHFLMRVTRHGPLVPARLVEVNHEPGEPENTRDRWPPTVLCADIAGEVVPPEDLTERFMAPTGHWKWPQPVSKQEYRYHFDRLRWAEENRPTDPALKPRRGVDPTHLPMPDFSRENAL
jgi:hypothetical protein